MEDDLDDQLRDLLDDHPDARINFDVDGRNGFVGAVAFDDDDGGGQITVTVQLV